MGLLLVLSLAIAQPEATYARAYELAYNLDHDEAIRLLKGAAAANPQSADAHRHVAIVTWLNILFRRGSVTVDSYLGGVTRSDFKLPKPPAHLEGDFRAYNGRAIELGEARARASRRDVDAMYDLGASLGLQASYVATIDGRVGSAFGSARRAYNLHEDVLSRDPRRNDAGLIVGTYRYVVSSLSLPARWAAYVVGFGGNKDRGIQLIEAAARGGEAEIDAKFALVLIYNRERRYADALRILSDLQRRFPRNRLLWLEKGATSIRAGLSAEAEAVLTEGLRKLDTDNRAKMPGERALWLYKRGTARIQQKRTADARRDLDAALAQGPLGWVQGRITLELGKAADLENDRAKAVSLYHRAAGICEANQDPFCKEEAARLAGSRYR